MPSVTDRLLIMYDILLRQLFFVAAVVYSGSWDFLYGRCIHLLGSEWNNAYFSRHLFWNSVWVAKSCITVCFTYSLRIAIFLNIDISQGSVATRLGCRGVFKYGFITNFLLCLQVKKLWKSVNIWWSYGQEFGVLFFWLTVYKKLSYRRRTARCVVSVETMPTAMQQCRNYLYDKSWTNQSYEVGGLQWDNV